jgi:hypothetical protein
MDRRFVCGVCGAVFVGHLSLGQHWAEGAGCVRHIGCEYRHQPDLPSHGPEWPGHGGPTVVISTSTSTATISVSGLNVGAVSSGSGSS